VAPHCDDEVLGCGGTMAKHANEGDNVYVVMITNGNIGAPELFSKSETEKNRKEAVKACRHLGVREVEFFDFPAPRLDTIASYKLSLALKDLIFRYQIDTMYIPHRGDIHLDHRITYECCLVAARPIDGCPVKRIYAYETLSETEWAAPLQNDTFIPVIFEDISEFLDKKIEAFKMYESQVKQYPHSRSIESIKALALHRGVTVGYKYAEAFMLVREIR
jgi:N-acetylglucosamine malate deacetylase 1